MRLQVDGLNRDVSQVRPGKNRFDVRVCFTQRRKDESHSGRQEVAGFPAALNQHPEQAWGLGVGSIAILCVSP